MGREQRADRGFDAVGVTNHFDTDFRHDLESSDSTQKGLATLGGTELALPRNLPGTAIVISNSTCARTEDGFLHRVDMGFGDVETQLIYHGLPSNHVHDGPIHSISCSAHALHAAKLRPFRYCCRLSGDGGRRA
jgi:hypothetical protein